MRTLLLMADDANQITSGSYIGEDREPLDDMTGMSVEDAIAEYEPGDGVEVVLPALNPNEQAEHEHPLT